MRPFHKLLLFSLVISALLFCLDSRIYDTPLAISSLCIFLFMARKDRLLCKIIGFVLVALIVNLFGNSVIYSFVVPQYSGFMANNALYATAIIVDISIIAFCYTKGKDYVERNHALKNVVGCIRTLHIFFLFINMVTISENLIRNLDKMGMPESFAKFFWHWQFMYDNHNYLQIFLMMMTLTFIYIGIHASKNEMKRRNTQACVS